MAEFKFPTDPMEICPCLYGTESYFSRCVGYCSLHKAYLTSRQLKTKNCLGKQCNFLIKQLNHPFWVERSVHKLDKKIKKEEIALQLHEIEIKCKNTQKKLEPVKRLKRYICIDLEMSELTSKERKSVKGLSGEVIQIGAVMLDEDFNCISQFNTYVKPVYSSVNENITGITGITNEMVSHADTFTTAFYKFYSWVGKEDITTFCWSDSDYTQLWDEIFIKARNHNEYRNFLKTFVDLQEGLNRILKAKKVLSLDSAMKLCHLKFQGQRHSAFSDAFNTARVLNKLKDTNNILNELPHISTYVKTGMEKKFDSSIMKNKEFTSSIASFMDPELLLKFGYKETEQEKKQEIKQAKQSLFVKLFSKKITCLKYGIAPSVWIRFSVKMIFTKDMKVMETVRL